MVSSNISSTCLHNMMNFGLLAAEIVSLVLGTPGNFNGFASWQRYCTDVAQRTSTKLCMMVVSLAGIMCIHFGAFVPQRNCASCKIHFASKSCVLLYWQRYCTSLEQRPSVKLCGVVQGIQGMELRNFRRGRHLYSAGRPSRLASAHILVYCC